MCYISCFIIIIIIIILLLLLLYVALVKKGKVHPITCREDPVGITKYSYTLSLTLAIDGVGSQRHAPAALPPGKTRYPFYRRLGGPQVRSARARKI